MVGWWSRYCGIAGPPRYGASGLSSAGDGTDDGQRGHRTRVPSSTHAGMVRSYRLVGRSGRAGRRRRWRRRATARRSWRRCSAGAGEPCVCSLMASAVAISWFDRPAATSRSTSTSRPVSVPAPPGPVRVGTPSDRSSALAVSAWLAAWSRSKATRAALASATATSGTSSAKARASSRRVRASSIGSWAGRTRPAPDAAGRGVAPAAGHPDPPSGQRRHRPQIRSPLGPGDGRRRRRTRGPGTAPHPGPPGPAPTRPRPGRTRTPDGQPRRRRRYAGPPGLAGSGPSSPTDDDTAGAGRVIEGRRVA